MAARTTKKQATRSAAKGKAKLTPKEKGQFGKLGGAPRKEIDYAIFEGLCRTMCTEEEIAAIFDIDTNTLNARIKERYGEGFSEVYKKKSAAGKMSLRRAQIKAAEGGNATMLIWLGKQYLGQVDKHEVTGNEGAPLFEPFVSAIEKVYGKQQEPTTKTG